MTLPDAHRRRRELVPECAEECWVDVDGLCIRYLRCGSGPPLVLLHGLLGFSFSWTENLAALAAVRSVIALDLPNVGHSGRGTTDPSLAGHARWLARFLDVLQMPQADILASSHGGAVAMRFAVDYPERVGKLILVSPANPFSERWRWQVELFTSFFGRPLAHLTPHLSRMMHWFWLARMYRRMSRALPGTLEGYSAPLRIKGTIPHVLRLLDTWYADFAQLGKDISALKGRDIKFIWGADDGVVPLGTGQRLSELLGAELTPIPDSGHLPYEELPKEFNALALKILSS